MRLKSAFIRPEYFSISHRVFFFSFIAVSPVIIVHQFLYQSDIPLPAYFCEELMPVPRVSRIICAKAMAPAFMKALRQILLHIAKDFYANVAQVHLQDCIPAAHQVGGKPEYPG